MTSPHPMYSPSPRHQVKLKVKCSSPITQYSLVVKQLLIRKSYKLTFTKIVRQRRSRSICRGRMKIFLWSYAVTLRTTNCTFELQAWIEETYLWRYSILCLWIHIRLSPICRRKNLSFVIFAILNSTTLTSSPAEVPDDLFNVSDVNRLCLKNAHRM